MPISEKNSLLRSPAPPSPPLHNMLRDCRVYENVVACIIGPLHYRTFPAELGKTLPERHEKLQLICIVV